MSGLTRSPRILKGGLVLIHPESAQVQRVISLQYNPESLTRTLQPKPASAGGEGSQPLRLKGPAVETLSLEAEIDAADQLEFPDQHAAVVEHGIQPQLAVLETLIHPASSRLLENNALAAAGTLEIAPMESALTLFVWSKSRIVPVSVTSFSIVEEFFDTALNPIRAKVTLGLQVLSVDDLGFNHKGGSLFMAYLQAKEQLATKAASASFDTLGVGGIP
jgi:hypothetical protein